MAMTAKRLIDLGLINNIVREPIGGAHRNPVQIAKGLEAVLMNEHIALIPLSIDELRTPLPTSAWPRRL
jgi:acetyl-CoA carboxylase carboxyl transferase subunit alpha